MISSDTHAHYPHVIKIYFLSSKILHRFFQRLYSAIMMCFTGFWLGLLSRESLYLIDECYYDNDAKYYSNEYNGQGLSDWEARAINKHFINCKKILVIGAGGGREILALHKMGFQVDGFECNERLVNYTNSFLANEGIVSRIKHHLRDEYPHSSEMYDGIVVGWGVYMLIQGKQRRTEFLKCIRGHVQNNAPILLSFFCRSDRDRRFKCAVKIANLIRGVLGRDDLELGDYLHPNYVHFFTEEELCGEMRAGGFLVALYSTQHYGHAVGLAG